MLTDLYIARKDGGSGLIVIEDCIELAVRGLQMYFHGSEERLLQAARGDRVEISRMRLQERDCKRRKRLQDWEDKVLHGQYLRQTKEVRSEQSWVWLQNGDLKTFKKLYGPFLWMGFNCLKARATSRRQFTFYH